MFFFLGKLTILGQRINLQENPKILVFPGIRRNPVKILVRIPFSCEVPGFPAKIITLYVDVVNKGIFAHVHHRQNEKIIGSQLKDYKFISILVAIKNASIFFKTIFSSERKQHAKRENRRGNEIEFRFNLQFEKIETFFMATNIVVCQSVRKVVDFKMPELNLQAKT